MASTACWRCLPRPATVPLTSQLQRLSITAAAFSTSAQFAAAKVPGKPVAKLTAAQKSLKQRASQSKTLKLKKKVRVKTGKPPMPGERKALRKRVVLSNTNALEVQGLKDLDAEMVGEGGKEWEGRVVGLEGTTVDCLRASEAFKPNQNWGLFRRPGVLIRKETTELGEKLLKAEKDKKVLRLVLDGQRVAGKSLMVISGLAMAHVKGWVVLNLPEAQDIVNASTEYAPIPNTPLYSQNEYTAAWLTAISKANHGILDKLELSQQHPDVPIPLQENISLVRLCELGARDPELAWPIFSALWKELSSPGRPPIMLALDGLQHIMQDSLYRNADNNPIHAHDLAIVNHFVTYLSGQQQLPNGGAVLAATSRSHAPVSKSLDLAITQAFERISGPEVFHRSQWAKGRYSSHRATAAFRDDPTVHSIALPTIADPWEKAYDARVDAALASVEALKVGALTKVEARGLMEYWAQSGVLRAQIDERTVAEKWALGGNGNIGEIQRGTLMMRI